MCVAFHISGVFVSENYFRFEFKWFLPLGEGYYHHGSSASACHIPGSFIWPKLIFDLLSSPKCPKNAPTMPRNPKNGTFWNMVIFETDDGNKNHI